MPGPITFARMPEAGGDLVSQKRTHKWCLTGIFNEAAALNYALMNIPIYLVTEALFRQNVVPRTQGNDLWYFDVEYGPVPLFAGTWSFSFDTTGGTIHWIQSLECREVYVALDGSGNPIQPGDNATTKEDAAGNTLKKPLIGERELGQIEGTDRVIPVCKLSYTYRKPRGIVTEAYVRYMTSLVGVTNLNPWHGYPRGELLYLGMRGTSTLGADAETSLTFEMAASPNVTGMTLGIADWGVCTGVAKRGHELIDAIFQEAAPGGAGAGKKLRMIRIHRLYEELDFASYLGF